MWARSFCGHDKSFGAKQVLPRIQGGRGHPGVATDLGNALIARVHHLFDDLLFELRTIDRHISIFPVPQWIEFVSLRVWTTIVKEGAPAFDLIFK